MIKSKYIVAMLIALCTLGCSKGISDAEKMNNKGINDFHRGHYEKALEEFSQAIILDSSDARMFNNRGLVYHTLGEYKKALADYAHALSLKPTFMKFIITLP